MSSAGTTFVGVGLSKDVDWSLFGITSVFARVVHVVVRETTPPFIARLCGVASEATHGLLGMLMPAFAVISGRRGAFAVVLSMAVVSNVALAIVCANHVRGSVGVVRRRK